MNKLLITGANGYIGSRFIDKFKQDYKIEPVSLSLGEPVNFINVSTVLHLSALVHQFKNIANDEYYRINTEQTVNIAKKAKTAGVHHFIFYSTMAVYGKFGDFTDQQEFINEQTDCQPVDIYGKSKLEAEKLLIKMEDKNFKISIIRPPIVYGVDCPGNMQRLQKLITMLPILPFNYNSNKRSMINIDNLLHFTKLVIDKQVLGVLIPQDNDKYSIKQIIETIAKGMNKKPYLVKFPKIIFNFLMKLKPKMMTSLYGTYLIDSTESNRKTGFIEVTTVEEGLLSM